MTKVLPKHEIRMGRVKAAIWTNETETGQRFNVTFSRLYKDGDGWKTTESFGRDELPLLAKVADMTHTWIFEQVASVDSRRDEGAEPQPAE